MAAYLAKRGSDQFFQAVEQGTLALKDLYASNRQGEPAGAIDLRKGLQPSAVRRPLHFERVAPDGADIQVALGRESVNPLAAALAYLAQRPQRSGRRNAELLCKFPLRDGKRIFTGIDFALRYRPCAVVLVAPERSAGMDKQHLQGLPATSVHQDPCACCGHDRRSVRPPTTPCLF